MNIKTPLCLVLSLLLIIPGTLLQGTKRRHILDFLDCSDPLMTPVKQQRMRADCIREKNEQLIKTSGLSEAHQQRLLGYYCSQTILSDEDILTTLRFSPNGRYLAANRRNKIVIFSSDNLKEPVAVLRHHEKPVLALSFSPDGRYLVSGAQDKKIIFWNARTFSTTPLKIVQENNPPIIDLSFSPDGRFLAAGGKDGIIKFWKVARHQQDESTINPEDILLQESTLRIHQKNSVFSLCFSPCSQYLAVAVYQDDLVQIFATDTITSNSRPIKLLQTETSPGLLSFSPDGRYIAISHAQKNSLEVWNAHTFTKQTTFHVSSIRPAGSLYIPAFSPDSRMLIVWSRCNIFTNPIHIFNTDLFPNNPDQIASHTRITSNDMICALTFSPDNTSFLCAGDALRDRRKNFIKIFQPYYLLSPDYIQFLVKYYKKPISFDDLSDVDKILLMEMPEGARPLALLSENERINIAQTLLSELRHFITNTSEYNSVRE